MENEKKTATSNAEMVTVSRAEYESQQAQLTELKLQNQWLLEQLGLAKKREFGSSSERIQEELMDQLAFSLNEAEAYAYEVCLQHYIERGNTEELAHQIVDHLNEEDIFRTYEIIQQEKNVEESCVIPAFPDLEKNAI